MDERRAAPRIPIRPGMEATVSDVPVRIVELSEIGARIEHEERFPLTAPELHIKGAGVGIRLSIRVARSEIVGKSGSNFTYRTGVQFTGDQRLATDVLSAIVRDAGGKAETAPVAEIAAPAAAEVPRVPEITPASQQIETLPEPSPHPALDDTWTRQVRFLKADPEDDLPFAEFRRTADGWKKSYVATPTQPEDGFTIPRDQHDFVELQHTFDCADAETRRMMQIALQAKLEAK